MHKNLPKVIAVATLAFLLCLFPSRALATSMITFYRGVDGNQRKVVAEMVESTTTSLDGGWWVVSKSVTTEQRITINGDTNLILADESTLQANDGIHIAPGAKLTIWAATNDKRMVGKLNAISKERSAIGSNPKSSGGELVINGGIIHADGGCDSAAIGGSEGGTLASVTINGGWVHAEAWQQESQSERYMNSSAGIGGGWNANGFPVTINDGEVYAKGGNLAAGIGGGGNLGSGSYGAGGGCYINGGKVTAIGGERGAGIGGGNGGRSQGVTITGGTVEAKGGTYGAGIGGGRAAYSDGIRISGGEVTAIGGGYGAGIGGGYEGHSTQIWIDGGTVVAKATSPGPAWASAAGIGGGWGGDFSSEMVVTGGDVTAIGALGGAGIGAGAKANMTGSLRVTGGIVRAYGGASAQKRVGSNENRGAAGIGGGEEIDSNSGGEGGTVIVEGGTVIACGGGGWQCAIGHGYNDRVMGSLTIADDMWVNWTNAVTPGSVQSDYTFSAPAALNFTPSWADRRVYDCNYMRFVTIEKCPHLATGATDDSSKYIDSSPEEHALNYDCQYCKAGHLGSTTQPHDFTSGTEEHTCICGHKEHAITFYADENGTKEHVPTKYYSDGTLIDPAAPPTPPEGYVFDGWYEKRPSGSYSDRKYNFTYTVDRDVKLYPKWSRDVVTYTVRFYSYDGSAYGPHVIDAGNLIDRLPTPVERDSWEFDGWYEKDENGKYADSPYDFGQPITRDVTVWEKWSLIVNYGVVFHPENGENSWASSVRKGKQVSRPTDPSREGYEFEGWYEKDGDTYFSNPFDFTTPITAPLNLYASWKAPVYTVTFDPHGGAFAEAGTSEDPTHQAVASGDAAIKPTDPVWEGHEFVEWQLNDVAYDFSKPVTGDITLVAEWTWDVTVSFDSDGGSAVPSQTVKVGSKVTKPADPTKEGSTFSGWYLEGANDDGSSDRPWDFDADAVAEDVTLKAHWDKDSYTITYDLGYEGAPAPSVFSVFFGNLLPVPDEPTREGYVFDGWHEKSEDSILPNPFNFETKADRDVTLVALWSEETHTVTFDANGGTEVAAQEVTYGNTAERPADPTREGYRFAGWNLDGSSYGFDAPVTADITLVAQWEKLVTVTFDAAGGSAVAPVQTVAGSKVARPDDPTRVGYTFLDWFEGDAEDAFDFGNPVTDDITLVASWEAVYYTFTFDPNYEGAAGSVEQQVRHGSHARRGEPARDGFLFAGWYTTADCAVPYDFSAPVTSDVTVYAKWVERVPDTYTVSFDSDGGTDVEAQQVTEGDQATEPDDPTREGHDFAGWTLEGEAYDFSAPVTSDITLKATWTPRTYAVTFDSDGGTEVESQAVRHGEAATRPADPTREGHAFLGWRLNGASYGFDEPVTGDITLVAAWGRVCTVTFDSAGGSDVAPAAVLSGDRVARPDDPTREGHDFAGWTLGGEAYDFSAPVTDDITLVAGWTPRTYTVAFETDGGTEVEPQQVARGGLATRPADPTREGHAFLGWRLNGASYGFDEPVTGDITLVAAWGRVVTVSFDPAGGTAVDAQRLMEGQAATRPDDPTREGHDFAGWTLGGEAYDFSAPVTDDITLKASWTPKTYTVAFETDGGSAVDPQTVKHGGRARRGEEPAKDGFLFAGWYTTADCAVPYDFSAPVTSDVTVYAKWVEKVPDTHTVTFDSDGGTDVEAQQVTEGDQATEPADPTREGHDFAGWTLDGEAYDFSAPVTSDITLKAAWTPRTYAITYDANGGGGSMASREVEYGTTATLDRNEFAREGHDFAGWNTEADGSGSAYADQGALDVTGDVTLYAQWRQLPRQHQVVFDSCGGSEVAAQLVTEGEKAAEPENPTREGYTFLGWFDGDAPYDFDEPVTSDITLTARWEAVTYEVTFDSKGGTEVEPQKVARGKLATRPADPTREGYRFAGWKLDGASYGFDEPVTGDITLDAAWAKICTVTFDSAGGSDVAPAAVLSGDRVARPADPTREHYTFDGWYKGDAAFDFDAPVLNDTMLTAHWKADTYTVTFETDGGSAVEAQTVVYGGRARRGEEPTKEGFLFAGWFTTAELTKPYDFGTPVTSDVTVYAKWVERVPDTYTVSFDSDGGTDVEAQQVTEGEAATEPADPTREGHDFAGWTLEGEPYDFSAPVTSDITLKATWTPKTYTITYDANGGGGSMAGREVEYGTTATLDRNEFAREGHDFAGWNTEADGSGSAYADQGALDVTGDVTLYAQWRQLPRQHQVVFDSCGGSEVAAQLVTEGEKATKPADPTREGFEFEGWYQRDAAGELSETYDFSAPVTASVTLYAKWKMPVHVVTFDPNGGTLASLDDAQQNVEHGALASRPTDPTREGFRFAGWTLGDTSYAFDEPVTTDLKLVAKWAKVCIVTFDSAGGSDVAPAAVLSGERVARPADPTREGYDFAGWTLDGESYDFSASVTDDIALVASWEVKTYTVTFETDGGSAVDPQTVKHGGYARRGDEPTKEGFLFAGWFTTAELTKPYDFGTPVTSDVTVYAKWVERVPDTYTVTFDSDGGTDVEAQQVTEGEQAARPADPTREGHDFAGWTLGGEPYDFSAPVTSDITLLASWTPKTYTVTFDPAYDGASAIDDQEVNHGQTATQPAAPTREGYAFMGWHEKKDDVVSDSTFDFATPITSDVDLCAAWLEMPKQYMVVFETLGGSAVETQMVTEGAQATKPTDPTRSCYRFVRWCGSSDLKSEYDFATPVTQDITLYAEWVSQSVTVTFDSMGGSAVKAQTVMRGAHPSKPSNPTRDGYVFSHWYLDDEGTGYDFGAAIYDDITLHAAWTEVEPQVEPGTITGIVVLQDSWTVESSNINAVAQVTPNSEEMAAVEDGSDAVLRLIVSALDPVPAADKEAVAPVLDSLGATEGSWADLSLVLVVDGREDRAVTETDVPAELSVTVPSDLRKDGRTFWLIRCHGGKAEVIATTTGDILEGESTLFSSYLIAFADKATDPDPEPEPEPTPEPAKEATFSFDANGGSGSMLPLKGTTGSTAILPAGTFKRSGYTFAGWNTKADGSGVAYADGAEVTFKSDTVLYAQWKKNSPATPDKKPATSSGTAAKPSTGATRGLPKTGDVQSYAVFAFALLGSMALCLGGALARRRR